MKQNRTKAWRYYLKWVLWILVFQIVLANISASIYAYKFTHLYDGPAPAPTHDNVFIRTWKLFVGPKFYKNPEELKPSFAYESFKLKLEDGQQIDGWYSPTDSSKGCVIFLHGITMNKSMLVNEASKFKQWGYSVLMIDFRAHGVSDGHSTSFGMRETEEAKLAFEWAKRNANIKIIFYGVSLGAVVAIKATAENKIQPTAIIADAPFANLHSHLQARSREIGFPSEPFGALVTMWIGIEKGFNGFNHDVNDYAQKVQCPVLLECGDADRYVSVEEIKKIYNRFPSAHKKLVLYPGLDHESYLHAAPLNWESEMNSFLSGL